MADNDNPISPAAKAIFEWCFNVHGDARQEPEVLEAMVDKTVSDRWLDTLHHNTPVQLAEAFHLDVARALGVHPAQLDEAMRQFRKEDDDLLDFATGWEILACAVGDFLGLEHDPDAPILSGTIH